MSKELAITIMIGIVLFSMFFLNHFIQIDKPSLKERIIRLEVQFDHEKRLNTIEGKTKLVEQEK